MYNQSHPLIDYNWLQQNQNFTMIELFQDRRIFLNAKKKPNPKNIFPDLKFSPVITRKFNKDPTPSSDNGLILYSYQPLSNILVSKRIAPSTTEQVSLTNKKHTSLNLNAHNFKIRKNSVKRISDAQPDENNDKRNSTSLSQRMPRIVIQNEQASLDQLKLNKIIKTDQLTFSVVKGNNNEDLIRQLMCERKIWKQIKFGEGIANFKWVFYKDRHNYKKMWSYTKKRFINHFEFNQEICTKDSLVKNLQLYCETKKIEVFNITPITFIIDFDDQYCEYNIKQFISFFVKNDPRKTTNKRGNLPWSFVSKFQGYMGWQNSDIKKKINLLSKPINNNTYYSQDTYLWLLKPTGLNRGRGIQIFDSLEQLEKILIDYLELMNRKKFKEAPKEKEKHDKNTEKVHQKPQKIIEKQDSYIKDSQKDTAQLQSTPQTKFVCAQKFKLNTCSFVIQKYVQKPFLIHNRKFDIRVWTLLTEQMNIYFFKQGYIRTSAETFSTGNIDNYFIHLTNNAIQKYSQNYGQFQNANQLSFWDLKQFMPEQAVTHIWRRIKQITYMAFSSVKKKINQNQRKHCFEIFGLDFFIDSELKVWLIEVNQNPCIQCSSPLLGQLIPRMLNDAFKLTIDILIDKKCEQKAYPVDNYPDTQNMWEKLGQLIPNGEYSPKK